LASSMIACPAEEVAAFSAPLLAATNVYEGSEVQNRFIQSSIMAYPPPFPQCLCHCPFFLEL
jgi:hypothetical protein